MKEPLPKSIDALMLLVADGGGVALETRIHAISSLGDLQDPRGIHCLLERVQADSHPRIVSHCIGVLSRLKAYSAVMAVVDVMLAHQVKIYEHPDPPDFPQTEESLRLRCAAAQALGRMGDRRAIVPLMSLLANRGENYRLRLVAAESLGRLGDVHAVHPLLEIVSDDQEQSLYLKESAVKALGMLGDIRALEPLIDELEARQGLRDKFHFFKEQIIQAIGRIGRKNTSRALQSLLYGLRDESAAIRLATVEALGALGDPQGLDFLREMLFDKDDDVATATIAAIHAVGGRQALEDLLRLENLSQLLRDELHSYLC